jgi:hypothetical protein
MPFLGGASGSGCDRLIFNTILVDDYFFHVLETRLWWDTGEDTDGIVNMMRTWTEIWPEEKKDDWRWAAHWSVVGSQKCPTLGNRIQLEGSWVALKSQAQSITVRRLMIAAPTTNTFGILMLPSRCQNVAT